MKKKPTRDEFTQTILRDFPGAFIAPADRGLIVAVGRPEIAAVIKVNAKTSGLTIGPAEEHHDKETTVVRIFGFPREKKGSQPAPALAYTLPNDEHLRAYFTEIVRETDLPPATDPKIPDMLFRLSEIRKLANMGLLLLAGKESK